MDGTQMTDNKNCKNCKNYVEHYIIITSVQLSPVGGHCMKKYRRKTPLEITDVCEHWESNEDISAKTQKTLTDYLRNVEKRLKDIQIILSLDRK